MQIEELERRGETSAMELNELKVCAAHMYGGKVAHFSGSYPSVIIYSSGLSAYSWCGDGTHSIHLVIKP